MTISYTSGDPISAYKVLVGVIAHYDEITDHNFSNVIMNTIVEPFVPMSVSNPISYGRMDIMAAAALMMLSLFFIVVTSYFRDTVKNDTDVNEMLDTKLFSVIYHENKNKTLKAKLGFVHSKDPLLILNILINYRFVEAFKVAALKVEYLIRAKNVKTLMITSCGENEGKSTVSVNLALSLAKIGLKVLLIDADLRKPAVYKFFKSSVIESDIKGLGEILNDTVSINDTISLDKESGLYLMISNKKYRNSSELFTANRFQKLLDSLKNQFDIILLDTAPTSLVSDAEIIASSIDSALVVVRQDIAPVPEINDMIEMISDSGATVEGCIFNDVRMLPSIFNSGARSDAEQINIDKEVM